MQVSYTNQLNSNEPMAFFLLAERLTKYACHRFQDLSHHLTKTPTSTDSLSEVLQLTQWSDMQAVQKCLDKLAGLLTERCGQHSLQKSVAIQAALKGHLCAT